jgi:hypothetical protein
MLDPRRHRSSFVLAVALALASCAAPPHGASPPPPDSDEPPDDDGGAAGQSDAPGPGRADASTTPDAASDATPADTGGGGGGSGGGGSSIVSCYTVSTPSATCSLPVHCCFANYSTQHDGICDTGLCSWGTIDCDGPEDCPSGQRCCSHVLVDPELGITGHKLSCQTNACGAAPANRELCHPTSSVRGTCSSTTAACVTALGNDSDLPPSLHVCQ